MSKGYVGEASVSITEQDIQIHGGMGFTWENDAHLYYRRAKASELAFGDASFHMSLLKSCRFWS